MKSMIKTINGFTKQLISSDFSWKFRIRSTKSYQFYETSKSSSKSYNCIRSNLIHKCNLKEIGNFFFHAPSGNGEEVLKAWKTRHNNCDIISGICPCLIKNGCLPPKARLETFVSTKKILRSPYIDYWNCLNIKKVKTFTHVSW